MREITEKKEERLVVKCGLKERNERGSKMVEFCGR